MPPAMATLTHAAEHRALYTRKRSQCILVVPASGGAMSANPGTNLATSSAFEPQRSKRDCVSLTQESGVSEIRHNSFMTPLPYTLPARNQTLSAATHAKMAPANNAAGDIVPSAAQAPATIKVGITGTGSPS